MDQGTAEDSPDAAIAHAKAFQFRCGNCAAPVVWDPGSDALKCDSCGHTQKVEDSSKPVVEYDFRHGMAMVRTMGAENLAQGGHEVKCDNCGAETVLVQDSGRCPFCDSPRVVKHASTTAVIVPESLLPHKVTKEDSKKLYQQWVKSRWFAPSDLTKRAKLAGMDGIYLPYWTYDSETMTHYQGMRGEYYWVTVSYRDAQGNHRTRSERRTRWWPCSGSVHVSFDDILVCASKSLPRKLVQELEPWDMEALTPFHPGYVSGFVAERYQIGLEDGFQLAEQRMEPVIRQNIRADIGGDLQRIISMNVNHSNVTFKHLLLPLWISAFQYGKKTFRIMVNARTGEVQGERPWSVFKIMLLIVTILAALGGIIWAVQDRTSSSSSAPGDYPSGTSVGAVGTGMGSVGDVPGGSFGSGGPAFAPVDPTVGAVEKFGGAAAFDASGFLTEAGTWVKNDAPDNALTGIELEGLGDDGKVALGRAWYRYRSVEQSKAGTTCKKTVSLTGAGAQISDDSMLRKKSTDCKAALVEGPHCTLADVRARALAAKAPAAAADVELKAKSAKTPDVPTRGEWSYQSGKFKKKFADDCGVEPPAKPAKATKKKKPR